MSTTHFWNNHHQVHPKQNYFKPKNLKVSGSKLIPQYVTFLRIWTSIIKLKKSKRTIKYEQSRDTGNIGNTRHRTKTNKTKQNINATQNRKLRIWATWTTPKMSVNPGAQKCTLIYISYITRWSGQTKYVIIGICCFSANHATFMSKSKDWVALH